MSASQNVGNNENNVTIVEVVALALRDSRDGKYLLARRGPGGSGAGYWEFPGGKIESGETQEQALCREIMEELYFDLSSIKLNLIGVNLHSYINKNVRIYLWGAEVGEKPDFRLLDHDKAEWFLSEEIKEINLSEGDKYFIYLI